MQKISCGVWRTANIELPETAPLDQNCRQFIWGIFFLGFITTAEII